jgi:hypothetical protein
VCEQMRRLCDVQLVPGGGLYGTASNARAKAADNLPGRHSGASPGPPNNRGWSFRQAIHRWTRSIGDGIPAVPVLTYVAGASQRSALHQHQVDCHTIFRDGNVFRRKGHDGRLA